MIEAESLVNAYSRFAGLRLVRFDERRIVDVIDITSMTHQERRVFEVRFDGRYTITSYAVIGPARVMGLLARIHRRLHGCWMETDHTQMVWCGGLSARVRKCGYRCEGTTCHRQELLKQGFGGKP